MRATPMHSLERRAAVGFGALCVIACGSDRPTVASSSRAYEGGRPKVSAECKGPGYAGSPIEQQFTHLSATVVDSTGTPVPNVTAQACGTNICLNGTTDASGYVVIDQPVGMVKPAFKYGGGRAYAKFALPLGSASPLSVDLDGQATVAFDAPEAGVALVPGTTVTSRGVTLTLASDMNPVDVDPFDYDTADLKKFRAAEVPLESLPAAVDPSFGFELVVAVTPVGTKLCPAARMKVANSRGWPAEAPVEFFLHGVEVTEEWAPYSGWAKVTDGAVSSDGSTVETDAAGGIPILSIIGIRLAR